MDKAFYISKELLMTERNYVKDLSILCQEFIPGVRHAFDEEKLPPSLADFMTGCLPLKDFHASLAMELEQRLITWYKNREFQKKIQFKNFEN